MESLQSNLSKLKLTLPSARSIGQWLRQNLFSTWYNVLLTILCVWVVVQGVRGLGHWAIATAQWQVVTENWRLIFVGRYPVEQLWRLWLALMLLVGITTFSWGALQSWGRKHLLRVGKVGIGLILVAAIAQWGGSTFGWLGAIAGVALGSGMLGALCRRQSFWPRVQQWSPLPWLVSFLAMLWLISGGFGLTPVSTSFWNGLLLTVLVATLSIVLSFPLGVLLALGRRSPLPILRAVSIGYIELVRGLPLIGILFMAQVMLPLLLPPQVSVDQLIRAITGLTLFSAAYLAETVRGGLQSLPSGQWEAAKALGFSPPLTLGLIILPQALRAVIPAIVGQFIGLFKDTALLSIVGLVELTGIARSITSQPEYLGHYAEVYLVLGLIYWVFCYSMSLASRSLEHRLGQQS
jgi:general L-amino acid transport system permease protein